MRLRIDKFRIQLGVALRSFRVAGWAALCAATVHAATNNSSTADSRLRVAPPGAWVKVHSFELPPNNASIQAGDDQRWLLLEHQINAEDNETFVHVVRQILTVSGLQNAANLNIEFDPSYQSLVFHWVRICRGAKVLQQLDASKIKVIEPEHDLDEFVLSGRRTAVLVLNDVRVGDIIDYAYSRKGENPIFGGHFFGVIPLQMEQPAGRMYARVLWPNGRRLYATYHGARAIPAAAKLKDCVEYTWDFRNVPRLHIEDDLPDWYQPLPWVQLSDFQSWAQVNEWALQLFQNRSKLSTGLMRKIAQWRRIRTQEGRVLAVLRFLQDEVRYFGIEIGASSHRPSPASVVFDRRFGDCKDKSLLFVTILRALRIEAYPVLVNTEAGHTLDEWRPSAAAFDHVIVQVRLGEHVYWLDPTACYQRGPLAAHYLPDYERGLVVRPDTRALTVIPQTTGLPETKVTEYFQLHGQNGPGEFKVVTVAEGVDADELRARFATTSREDLANSWLHYYSRLYPAIKAAGPIEFSDNEQQDRVQVTESYTLDKGWERDSEDSLFHCQFYSYSIDALLRRPVDTRRTMPLSVPFPEHRTVRIEVSLPLLWPSYSQNVTVNDPAFTFRANTDVHGRSAVIEYEYRSTADSVPTNRVAEYLDHVNEASKALGYNLVWPP